MLTMAKRTSLLSQDAKKVFYFATKLCLFKQTGILTSISLAGVTIESMDRRGKIQQNIFPRNLQVGKIS